MERKKIELYDEICRVLTWYEHQEEYPFSGDGNTAEDIAEDMYNLLVKVQNEMCEEEPTTNMTVAEKYPHLKKKTIKDIVLEIVEQIANKTDKELEIVCGWWESPCEPYLDGKVFDMMSGECYHNEINQIMCEQGFVPYEYYGGYRSRAKTIYRLV